MPIYWPFCIICGHLITMVGSLKTGNNEDLNFIQGYFHLVFLSNQQTGLARTYARSTRKSVVNACVCVLSCLTLCNPWIAACQAPPSIEFCKEEHWSRLPFPSLGDLLDPGIEPPSPASPALAGRFFTTEPPGNPQ